MTGKELCHSFPLRPDFLAQLVIPRDLTARDAARLCEFVNSLVVSEPTTSRTEVLEAELKKMRLKRITMRRALRRLNKAHEILWRVVRLQGEKVMELRK